MSDLRTKLSSGALSRLRSQLSHLPPALRRLGNSILDDPHKAIYQSVTELAEQAQVGEASVIRFCRDLGFHGFQDFKLALAADLALSPGPAVNGTPRNLRDVIAHVKDQAVQALQATEAMLGEAQLERIVAMLETCSHLLVFGTGASGVTAKDVMYKFLRLGYTVICHEDAHMAAMATTTLTKDAVVIAITSSGSTLDTVRVLELAARRGLPTIVLTQRPKSPATSVADFALYTASPESPLTGGSIPSKIGQLLLLDTLYAALLLRREDAQQAVANTAQAVSDRNY